MTIRVDSNQGIHTIWLARAEKRNAFDGDMLHKLDEALQQAQEQESCRVVVIAAEGKAFCAGADLAWMAQQAAEGGEANIRGARTMGGIFHRISDCRKPVVARVHGATMGGGVGLASACDIVVASKRAFFALSEVRLGLVPAVISPFVVRRVGPSRARALFMTGGRVGADDAQRFGLVDHLVEHDEDLAALDACLKSVLGDLLKGGPEALYACKRLVDAVAFRDPADVLDMTARTIAERRASAEATEGITAFLTKQPASWIPSNDGE